MNRSPVQPMVRMNPTLTSSEVKRLFRSHGLAPKKWMGQNLLVDRSYLERIVRAAAVKPGEPVLEVGAGLGVLTEELAGAGAEVWALEVDSGFFRVLEDRFVGHERVHLIHADALKFEFRSLFENLGRLRVVANLPYNISSRLIFSFLENRDIFSSLTIMLQKEVAQRLAAEPNTKEYGILTVLLGVGSTVEPLFDIPGRAFYPVPKVDSTLVTVRFPNRPPVAVEDVILLTRLVKASFAARRKTLKNNLKKMGAGGVPFDAIAHAAQEAHIDLGRRAETLTPEEFAGLSDSLGRHMP